MLTAFKYWVYNQYRRYVWLLSRIGRPVNTFHSTGSELYVITVAYNHVRLIEKQVDKLKDGVDFREKKEAIPILWLISSLYASCQELHIGLHITCVPGKQEDQK